MSAMISQACRIFQLHQVLWPSAVGAYVPLRRFDVGWNPRLFGGFRLRSATAFWTHQAQSAHAYFFECF